ncbi:MAG: sigma 54-interacting transcriptional regulator [bacterium]|jgi:transcriptional regulator with PAS, ATPase and Fis domain
MANIIMVSPDPQVTRVCRNVFKRLDLEYVLIEASFKDAVAAVRQYENQANSTVVIARGATGYMIRDMTKFPTALIRLTQFDLIASFWEASRTERAVAFIGYKPAQEEYELHTLAKMFNLTIGAYWFDQIKEVPELLKAAREDGFHLVVGGKIVVNTARKQGMNGLFVRAQEESILEAIYRALDILQLVKRDAELNVWLKTIIDFSFAGILALDESGNIKLINKIAQSSLGIKAEQAVGQNIKDLCLGNRELLALVDRERPLLNQVVYIGQDAVVVNKVPLRVEDKFLGTLISFQPVHKLQRLEQKVRSQLQVKGLTARYSFGDIIGSSELTQKTIDRAKHYAETESTVLIYGETGTGKELFAQAIHNASHRKEGPFVAVNCAAFPPTLLESELFGYTEGAFTGAIRGGKPGLFELAHGGTILLDEISELPLELQGHLLRVLQEKEVRRVGGTSYLPVDVRVLAATNKDLSSQVEEGSFRQDLLFRLEVLKLVIPPLRAHPEDLMELFSYFVRKQGRQPEQILPDAAVEAKFLAYGWPGNIRELENLAQRLDALWDSGEPKEVLLQLAVELGQRSTGVQVQPGEANVITVVPGRLEEMETQLIRYFLQHKDLTQQELAATLGISRTTLWKKIQKLTI